MTWENANNINEKIKYETIYIISDYINIYLGLF